VATDPQQGLDVDAVLSMLAAAAAREVAGTDVASVTVRRADGTLQTVAATEETARLMDALQYELREGPCYAAVTDRTLILVNDMTSDEQFPRYGPEAARLGFKSQLALQFAHPNRGEVAGLNLYARRPNAFDQDSVQTAEMFSGHAAVVLGYAQRAESLADAVRTREAIGTAVGIVMARYGINHTRAFEYLVRLSNDQNVKLRQIAADIVNSAEAASSEADGGEHNSAS
jgi:GAF domain-containing protein